MYGGAVRTLRYWLTQGKTLRQTIAYVGFEQKKDYALVEPDRTNTL